MFITSCGFQAKLEPPKSGHSWIRFSIRYATYNIKTQKTPCRRLWKPLTWKIRL